jgi:hypothetical protein
MKESKKIYLSLEYRQILLCELFLFVFWHIQSFISAFHLHLHHLNHNTDDHAAQ